MEKSIADLLSDAFSESSVPSYVEDEDFESLDLKVDGTILSEDNSAEQEDASTLMEIASSFIYQNKLEVLDAKYNSQENYSSSEEKNEGEIDEKQSQSSNEEFCAVGRNPSDNYDMYKENIVNKEGIAPGVETLYPCNDVQETFSAKNIKDVKVRLEDFTSSVEEREEDEGEIEQKPGDFFATVRSRNDKEQVYAMRRDLGQKDKSQDSNQEEEGEIEEEGYFGVIQGHEGNLMVEDDSSEEDQTQLTKTTFFQVEYTLEYPEISYDRLEELNEDIDKMEHFSEEEHQEAGESFADYPSDFSSCEYVDNTTNGQSSDFESELDHISDNPTAATEDMSLKKETVEECTGGNSELCSKEELDKLEMTITDVKLREKEDNDATQSWTEDVFSNWSNSEDAKGLSKDRTDLDVTWELESENTEQNIPIMNRDERCLVRQDVPATVSSSCGSVDDSFFFNDESEVYDVMEEEQMEDDEKEERRREQARIQAFYRFYDEPEGDGNKEERQTKVQFCTETLSQVIHYDTDSSREVSSSSDEEDEEEEKEEEEEKDKEEEEEEKQEKEGEVMEEEEEGKQEKEGEVMEEEEEGKQEKEGEVMEEEEEGKQEKEGEVKEEEEEEKQELEGEVKEEEEEEKQEKEGEVKEEEEEEKQEKEGEVKEEEEEEKQEKEGEVKEEEKAEQQGEAEKEERDFDQMDEVESCPSVDSDEAILSFPELEEIEDLTLIGSPLEISHKITKSSNKPICKRNHRCLLVLKMMLSLFLVVVMGLIMFWWVSDVEEWPNVVF